MSKPLPPILSAYQSLLTKNRLQPNSAQASLVNQLGSLQSSLVDSRRPSIFSKDRDFPHQNGFYIYGGVGAGKSRIADLFSSTLPSSISNRRVHFHEFMIDVHTRLHHARSLPSFRGDPLISIGSEISRESKVLCLDEFQVTDIADAMILKRLFGAFWSGGGTMVSTSNRAPRELYLNGLNRGLFVPFINELERRCVVWRMEGERDYRLGDGNGAGSREKIQVWFTHRRAFERMTEEISGGVVFEVVNVKVAMSRSLSVKAALPRQEGESNSDAQGKAVVQASFDSLCRASLGTSDYHALCTFASTIFLSDIPKFASSDFDIIRRFITLIDIAYESRSRIVCCSEAPLAEVFAEIGVVMQPTDAASKAQDGTSTIVKGEGGSSSSMMSTFIDNVEWSATGLSKASLATGGAGETDVKFAVGRAMSRLSEMGWRSYGEIDD